MKKIIGNIEPNNVFGYFEDICNIPHVSYHTEKIQAYIEAFAIERGLAYHKDNYGNIVVFKVQYKTICSVMLYRNMQRNNNQIM